MTGHRPYRRGRDDTALARLERELHQAAASAAVDYGDMLAASITLNGRYAGRWHVWFVAQGPVVEWLARPAAGGEPLLSAPTADGLVSLIEDANVLPGFAAWLDTLDGNGPGGPDGVTG